MPSPSSSKLFTPIVLGALKLKHRCVCNVLLTHFFLTVLHEFSVVLAPLTRNRATKSTKHPRTWYPDALNVEYYTQRATKGGLLITEATYVYSNYQSDIHELIHHNFFQIHKRPGIWRGRRSRYLHRRAKVWMEEGRRFSPRQRWSVRHAM